MSIITRIIKYSNRAPLSQGPQSPRAQTVTKYHTKSRVDDV